MKKDAYLLPPDSFKIALGELLLQNFKLTLKKQPLAQSYRELGSIFCDMFNDKPDMPTISHATLLDVQASVVEVNGDNNVMMSFIKAALSQNDPSVMQRDASDFVMDEDLLDKTSTLLSQVRNEGLHSVMTDEIANHLSQSGCHVLAVPAPSSASKIQTEHPDGPNRSLEDWLIQRISDMRISRMTTDPEDGLASCLMATSYIVKAMSKANLLKKLIDYSMKQQIAALPTKMQSLVKTGKLKPINQADIDTEYLMRLDLDKPKFPKNEKSILGIALFNYKKSGHTQNDVITVMKILMPFLSVLRDFLNIQQQEEIKSRLYDLTQIEWKYSVKQATFYITDDMKKLSEIMDAFSKHKIEAKQFGQDAKQNYYLVYDEKDLTFERLSNIDSAHFSYVPTNTHAPKGV